jgi:Nucleotidyl transferase AbiEii toxin, Type IV TA system
MQHGRGSQVEESRLTGSLPGLNGVETCLMLSEEYGDLFWGRKLMERERVREILRALNEAHIHYAIIGGVAMGYHTIPRATQDIDVLVSREDIPRVQRLLQPYYRRGTAVVMVFDVEGTHLDVLPATLQYGRTAIDNAIEVLVHDIPAKVVSVRDLLLLKLFAIPDRPVLDKRRQDEADVTALLRQNADYISQEDITYLVRTLLGLAFTREDVEKYQRLIVWLNETLDLLGMADRRYQEGEHTQGHPPP